eukprot:CAMPEP_0204822914 /NCGR_PEP_ID=MMETSP1346-20131115/1089_1 /ASSEMBLY_ACC=CAM_ASM_000771 /TAXON_ID=215587 /ORGANISM="Aplanochytrium stocchinoi, Strain GSBS06" /LENGTH=366 /DNA_ID=CAMNT_0051949389 /DNA_START=220 /DNA_END=1320 /DNA_ORIENTATION=-
MNVRRSRRKRKLTSRGLSLALKGKDKFESASADIDFNPDSRSHRKPTSNGTYNFKTIPVARERIPSKQTIHRRKKPNVKIEDETSEHLDEVYKLIKKSKRIVAIVGAGISVSCGIPDFRSAGGVYSIVEEMDLDLPQPECLFDINFFRDDPIPFYKFAHKLYPGKSTSSSSIAEQNSKSVSISPSLTHKFLSKLEKMRKLQRVYTQNIDGLEKVAGIKRTVYCHGSLNDSSCLRCKEKVDSESIMDQIRAGKVATCRKSDCNGVMKPNITFFGEDVGNKINRSIQVDSVKADLVLVIGTSLNVAPVSKLPSLFPSYVPMILINKTAVQLRQDASNNSHLVVFKMELVGECDKIFAQLATKLKYHLE